MKQVVANFRSNDYKIIAASTLLSMPFGYFAGCSPAPFISLQLCVFCILPFRLQALIKSPFIPPGTSRLPQMRRPSMYMATFIGLTGGFALAFQVRFACFEPRNVFNQWLRRHMHRTHFLSHTQQSGGRLLGYLPNDEEVREARRA